MLSDVFVNAKNPKGLGNILQKLCEMKSSVYTYSKITKEDAMYNVRILMKEGFYVAPNTDDDHYDYEYIVYPKQSDVQKNYIIPFVNSIVANGYAKYSDLISVEEKYLQICAEEIEDLIRVLYDTSSDTSYIRKQLKNMYGIEKMIDIEVIFDSEKFLLENKKKYDSSFIITRLRGRNSCSLDEFLDKNNVEYKIIVDPSKTDGFDAELFVNDALENNILFSLDDNGCIIVDNTTDVPSCIVAHICKWLYPDKKWKGEECKFIFYNNEYDISFFVKVYQDYIEREIKNEMNAAYKLTDGSKSFSSFTIESIKPDNYGTATAITISAVLK